MNQKEFNVTTTARAILELNVIGVLNVPVHCLPNVPHKVTPK